MYLDFFGLEREPFHITPDPEFLFPSPSHKEAFATVMYGVQQQKGFVVVTGEVGTGKTTILRSYLQKLKGTSIQPIYIFDPHLEFDELLEAVLMELGAPADAGNTQFARLQWLRHFLIDAYSAGRSVVLIVDEAQNMPVGTMEQLRVLTNLETTKDKLLQVLLVGQPELEDKLSLHQLRQLNQRVAVRATLRALTPEESADYIKHRIRQAGGVPETILDPGAIKTVIKHAQGNPRVLNITCDNLFITAFGAQQCPITAKLAREVIREISPQQRLKQSTDWRRLAPLAAAASVVAIVGAAALALFQPEPRVDAAIPAPEQTPAPVEEAAPPAPAAALDAKEIAVQRMLGREVPEEALLNPEPGAVTYDAAAPPAPVPPVAVEALPAVEVASLPESAPETTAETEAVAPVAEPEPAPASEATEESVVAVVATPEPEEPKAEPMVEPEPAAETAKVAAHAPEPKAAAPAPEPQVIAPVPVEPVAQLEVPAPAPEQPTAETPAPREPREREALEKTTPPPPLVPLTAERDAEGRLVRKVEYGDQLNQILMEVYGEVDSEIVETTQELNPDLKDPDLIYTGDELVLPERKTQTETTAPAGTPDRGN